MQRFSRRARDRARWGWFMSRRGTAAGFVAARARLLACEAAAILLKGPPGPVLALLTAAALSIADRDFRWIRRLHPVPGLSLTARSLALGDRGRERDRRQLISESLLRDLLPKFIGAQESHGAPPGYYTSWRIASFWPARSSPSGLAWGWCRRHAPTVDFPACLARPRLDFLRALPTKLPHYVLPLYPALALLAGGALAAGFEDALSAGRDCFDHAVKALWAVVTVALAAALIMLPPGSAVRLRRRVDCRRPGLLGVAALLPFRIGGRCRPAP